jgi:D-3-phosphoglycerate dehydrogenase / 2-oxoglutarate reductase
MRILVADRLPSECVEALRGDGHDVTENAGLTADDLLVHLDHDALIVRSTRVTAETLEACERLTLVIRAGSGTNTIDTGAAADRGVYVCNVPGGNAVAVAELAIGLLAAIDRRIPDNVADLRAGRWRKSTYQKSRGLLGRDVGIIGLGEIGLAFAERAVALGMRVHGVRRPGRDQETTGRIEQLGIRLVGDLETLATVCDVLTLHLPATPETEGIIGRDLLARLRPGTIILNTARGELIDDEALLEVLDEKDIRVGLDVHRDEPKAGEASFTSPLIAHPNVYGTHHIGASTEQAQQAIGAEVVEIVRAFVAGETRNCVNLEERSLGSSTVIVRHVDRVGVLASVLRVLSEAGINVEQMGNEVFSGAKAACATMRVAGDLSEDVLGEISELPDVIHVAVAEATAEAR